MPLSSPSCWHNRYRRYSFPWNRVTTERPLGGRDRNPGPYLECTPHRRRSCGTGVTDVGRVFQTCSFGPGRRSSDPAQPFTAVAPMRRRDRSLFLLPLHAVQQNGCIRLTAPRLLGRIESERGHEDKDTAAN